jgi:hypothetical protein
MKGRWSNSGLVKILCPCGVHKEQYMICFDELSGKEKTEFLICSDEQNANGVHT